MADVTAMLTDFCLIGVFLVLGVVIRSKVGFFQRFVIPASVIGGLLGLLFGANGLGFLPMSEGFSLYPVILIDVVFSGLFIGRRIPPLGVLLKTAGAQAAFAYFNGFGQIVAGLLVVVVFGLAGLALHPAFGVELIVGYQGGPGVATAVAPMMDKLGWAAAESAAVGETCAIAGLILAVLVGMVLVNIGIARGLTVKSAASGGRPPLSLTFLPKDQRRSVGTEITSPESASTLAFNFGFMALAIIIGKLIVLGIVTAVPLLSFLPTFPFVLAGGIIVQIFLQKTDLDRYTDRASIESVGFFALDALIVASFMAINLKTVAVYAAPLLVMIAAGLVFNLWQVLWLAPRILPGAWFEKGLCEFGQNTGSVPQALLLLRMVDPRFETDAAEALALKMFMFSPIMTPATMLMLPLLISWGPGAVIGLYLVLMAVVLGLCRWLTWQKRPRVGWWG